MADPPTVTQLSELVERARILAGKDRALLGVTGAPGAGKSMLAQALVEQVGESARMVSMDGFHLARSRLRELGQLADIGAIDTFDAAGFLVLMRRLRCPTQEIVYAPEFRREIEEAVACAVPVEPYAKLVIVDGNYLLASQRPWRGLRELLDEVWYVEVEEPTRVSDLIARHRAYGASYEEAHRMAHGPDQRNAELVASTRSLANLIVRLDGRTR